MFAFLCCGDFTKTSMGNLDELGQSVIWTMRAMSNTSQRQCVEAVMDSGWNVFLKKPLGAPRWGIQKQITCFHRPPRAYQSCFHKLRCHFQKPTPSFVIHCLYCDVKLDFLGYEVVCNYELVCNLNIYELYKCCEACSHFSEKCDHSKIVMVPWISPMPTEDVINWSN